VSGIAHGKAREIARGREFREKEIKKTVQAEFLLVTKNKARATRLAPDGMKNIFLEK
jgi:hypothetical protein